MNKQLFVKWLALLGIPIGLGIFAGTIIYWWVGLLVGGIILGFWMLMERADKLIEWYDNLEKDTK